MGDSVKTSQEFLYSHQELDSERQVRNRSWQITCLLILLVSIFGNCTSVLGKVMHQILIRPLFGVVQLLTHSFQPVNALSVI